MTSSFILPTDVIGDSCLTEEGELSSPRTNTNLQGRQAVTNGFFGATFVCKRSEWVTRASFIAVSPVAVGATLVRFGFYDVDPVTEVMTLIAATANDPTIFTGAFAAYERNFLAPVYKQRGKTYCIGFQIVGATTLPSVACSSLSQGGAYLGRRPSVSRYVNGGADLPTTIASVQVIESVYLGYVAR